MAAKTSFRGSFTALVTPFSNGSARREGIARARRLADRRRHQRPGPGGHDRRKPDAIARGAPASRRMVHRAGQRPRAGRRRSGLELDQRGGRAFQHAKEAGADAVLVVTPYYNKPTQEGLYQHFKAINDAIGIPIIIYNIPARSVIDMSVDTMTRLYELKNIAGVKDATANVVRVSQQRAAMGRGFQSALRRGRRPRLASWRMAATAASRSHRTSRRGFAPSFRTPASRATMRTALKLQDKLMPLHTALFVETNPGAGQICAVACSASARTRCGCRWCRLAEKTRAAVREAMVHAGLVN